MNVTLITTNTSMENLVLKTKDSKSMKNYINTKLLSSSYYSLFFIGFLYKINNNIIVNKMKIRFFDIFGNSFTPTVSNSSHISTGV